MADNYSPEVIALVEQARRNQSPAPELNRPFYNPEISAQYNLQPYNDSQFYKLRMACATSKMPGTIIPQSMVQADPLVSGKVCDRVLDVAAEYTQQNKNEVSNPNHLLAPYSVAMKVRDIKSSNEVVLAYEAAAAYNNAVRNFDKTSRDTSKGGVKADVLVSTDKGRMPINVQSYKGLALDSSYAAATTYSIFQNEYHHGASLAGAGQQMLKNAENSQLCRTDGDIDRFDCWQNGAIKYVADNDKFVKKSASR